MTDPPSRGASTRVSRIAKAPGRAVYKAFLDPDSVASWLPPETMIGHVHMFEPREGGKYFPWEGKTPASGKSLKSSI